MKQINNNKTATKKQQIIECHNLINIVDASTLFSFIYCLSCFVFININHHFNYFSFSFFFPFTNQICSINNGQHFDGQTNVKEKKNSQHNGFECFRFFFVCFFVCALTFFFSHYSILLLLPVSTICFQTIFNKILYLTILFHQIIFVCMCMWMCVQT